MRFEYANVLWVLLLLIIPIIIHLFHFKRFKTLYFSSLIFVKQVEQETKSVKKLKHLLILISRLLAFIALILAFAKPYFPLSQNTPNSKISAIYIDNSYSMTNLRAEGQLFEVAKEKARRIVTELNDDEQFLIVTNNQSTDEQREYSKKEALEKINQLTLSPFSRTFSESANWMQTQLKSKESTTLNNLIYISDFQYISRNNKELLMDKQTKIFPIQLVPQKNSNIAIDTAWFSNPNFKLNTQNELHVILKNHGNQNLENVALNLKTNQTQRDIFVSLAANDTAQVVVSYSDMKQGWVNGKLSVMDEGITFDDDLYFSYDVQDKNNVVIINGEHAVPNIKSVYELDPFYNVQEFYYKNIDNSILQKANTIILNGLSNFSTGLIEQLVIKATEGAGVAIFPGKDPNIQELNALTQALGLVNVLGKVNEKFAITKISSKDLFFKGVFQKAPNNITLPSLNSYLRTALSGKTISLLRLENEAPVLLRSSQFNTFLFAGFLNKEEGNFMTDAIFSTCLLRFGELSTNVKPLYMTIGEDTQYPLVQDQPERPIRLINEKYEFIPFKVLRQGKSWISVKQIPNKNIVAGQYKIMDDKELGQVSINYDRNESALSYEDLDQFTQQLNEQGFKNVKSSVLKNIATVVPINTKNKQEYWKLLLILSLMFFLTEMTLIKFWK